MEFLNNDAPPGDMWNIIVSLVIVTLPYLGHHNLLELGIKC